MAGSSNSSYLTNRLSIRKPEPEEGEGHPEADLHQHVSCKKNKGHVDFIPVHKLSLEHFSQFPRKEFWFDYVKAWADLVVHLKGSTSSPDRPEFYPNTRDFYPFYVPGGGHKVKVGSGCVYRVTSCGEGGKRYRNKTCPCVESDCKNNPHKSWTELLVKTALHVLHDDVEARDTEVSLFFDSRDGVGTVRLMAHKVVYTRIDEDFCVFSVIVHDNEVVARLEEAMRRVERLGKQLRERMVDDSSKDLDVAVSHPHGCSKMVSVRKGQWKWDNFLCVQMFHQAPTCPGSSGGFVLAAPLINKFGAFSAHHTAAMPDGTGEAWWCWLPSGYGDSDDDGGGGD